MTKLYLFNEDGKLAFCEEVKITTQNLRKVEEIGNQGEHGCVETLFSSLLERIKTNTANGNCQLAMAE